MKTRTGIEFNEEQAAEAVEFVLALWNALPAVVDPGPVALPVMFDTLTVAKLAKLARSLREGKDA